MLGNPLKIREPTKPLSHSPLWEGRGQIYSSAIGCWVLTNNTLRAPIRRRLGWETPASTPPVHSIREVFIKTTSHIPFKVTRREREISDTDQHFRNTVSVCVGCRPSWRNHPTENQQTFWPKAARFTCHSASEVAEFRPRPRLQQIMVFFS